MSPLPSPETADEQTAVHSLIQGSLEDGVWDAAQELYELSGVMFTMDDAEGARTCGTWIDGAVYAPATIAAYEAAIGRGITAATRYELSHAAAFLERRRAEAAQVLARRQQRPPQR